MSKSHFIIPIFVPHEGCPHNCVFCNQNSITGSTTSVTASLVKETIDRYLETIPKENRKLEISFFGGTFTAIEMEKQNELLQVAKHYKDLGIVDFIRLSTRPDYINDEILSNLKKYSVDIIELGVQSLDNVVLQKSARGHTEEDVINASELIRRNGFTLGHQIMLGLPGDNFEKDICTTKKIINLSPDICRIYPSLVIKDTPMEVMFNMGIYSPYSLEEAVYISKIIHGMLVANGIKVIRIGLQPTEDINEGKDIVTGPFHPAFRELVEGSIYNDMILENSPKSFSGDLNIKINSKEISKLYCNKKKFFNDIKGQLKTLNIKVNQDDNVKRGEILLQWNEKCLFLSIDEFLSKKYKEGYFNIL